MTLEELLAKPLDTTRTPIATTPGGPVFIGWMMREWPIANMEFTTSGRATITSSTPLVARRAVWEYWEQHGAEHMIKEIA